MNLLKADFSDLLLGWWDDPDDLFHQLSSATRLRALQCGETGPFDQVIAGLDIALWDLFARRADMPLLKFMNEKQTDVVPVYASGIHIGAGLSEIDHARRAGYSRFKVKVGFDLQTDIAAVLDLSEHLRTGESLAADANQAWDLETAKRFATGVADA